MPEAASNPEPERPFQAPDNELPVTVPIDLLLVRTADLAVTLTGVQGLPQRRRICCERAVPHPVGAAGPAASAARHWRTPTDAARLLVEQATLTPALVGEISAALTRVTDTSSDWYVPVRSSATSEDGADAAAAGQHDTFPGSTRARPGS